MTRRTFAASLLGAAAVPLFSQTGEPITKAQQRGRQLMQQVIGSLGGQAFLDMRNRLEEGRAYQFYRERLSGLAVAQLYTEYLPIPKPVPDSFYGIAERQVFGKKHEDVVIFNPEGAWEITFRGARPLPDDAVTKHKDASITNILYILHQRLHEPGILFESRGVDVVDNSRVEGVDVFDNSGRQVTVYINADTMLPVMQRYMRFDPMYKEKIEEVTRFSKYKKEGEITWPMDVCREHDGEKVYQMFSESYKVNGNFADSMFKIPEGLTLLDKPKS
jgi:hypothetical protein